MKKTIETIVHASSLVGASYALSTNEMRLINLAAMKIDSRAKNIGDIDITVEEFNRAYSITREGTYTDLKKTVDQLMSKHVQIFDSKRNEIVKLAWIGKSIYSASKDASHVTIAFSQYIEPFLFELKERFTAINFECASKLNTPFSFRLYQWLKEVEHLNNHKINGAITRTLDVKWMKDKAQLADSHDRWSNFNDKVIKPAINKINANTDLYVVAKPVKSGRKVMAVEFTYVVESDPTCTKPMRPRLHRRPKVMKGTHEEGVWMRKNLALLLEYEAQLKRYDDKGILSISDLRKIAEYASICDRITEDRARKEIELRTLK